MGQSTQQHVHDVVDVHPALAAVDWDAFDLAWVRYEDARIRPEVVRVLGEEAFGGWKGFYQRLLSGEPPDGSDGLDEYADSVVRPLFDAAEELGGDAEGRAALRAFVSVYVLFAILAGWELCDRHDWLRAMVRALGEAVPDDTGGAPSGVQASYQRVATEARALAESLESQFDWENALFCSCPISLATSAGEAVTCLEPLARREGGTTGTLFNLKSDLDERSPRDLKSMVSVLCRAGDAALQYARFLQRVVAPASDVFVVALGNRAEAEAMARARNYGSVAALLQDAEAEAVKVVEALDGNVFASAARAFPDSFHRMAEGLLGPSLTVEDGEIVLLFPFGMPKVDPEDLVRSLMGAPENPDPLGAYVMQRRGVRRLVDEGLLDGIAVAVEEQPMSNAFAVLGAGTVGGEPTKGVRLVFSEHSLVLRTRAGTEVRGLDLEVRLGSLGNHAVRVAVTTDHLVKPKDGVGTRPSGWRGHDVLRSENDGAAIRPSGWTGHDVDQWVRRAGFEVGSETVRLEKIGAPPSPTDPEYRQIVELAEAIVNDLHTCLLGRVNSTPSGEPDPPDRDRDVNDLHANAQVLIVVRQVSEHKADGSPPRTLDDVERFPELLGSQALLMPQRGLTATLEDWVRYDVQETKNLLDGRGRPGDLLAVNGDVTLLCALRSPSWVALEMQHIVEFAVSAVGPLAAWSLWLRNTAEQSTGAIQEAAKHENLKVVFRESADVAKKVGDVRALLDHLQSAQLMRSHRDRELLAQFAEASVIEPLEESLEASIESVLALRSYGTTQVERLIEERRKRVESFLEGVFAVLAVAGLAGLFEWLGAGLRWTPHHVVWEQVVVLGVVTAIVLALRFWSPYRAWRRWSGSR